MLLSLLAWSWSGAVAEGGGFAGTVLCSLILAASECLVVLLCRNRHGDTGPAGKIAVINPDAALMGSSNLPLLWNVWSTFKLPLTPAACILSVAFCFLKQCFSRLSCAASGVIFPCPVLPPVHDGFSSHILQSSCCLRVVGSNRVAWVQTLCKERERGTRWPHQHPAGRAGPEYGAPAKDLDLFCHLSHHVQILHFFLSSFFFLLHFAYTYFFLDTTDWLRLGPLVCLVPHLQAH